MMGNHSSHAKHKGHGRAFLRNSMEPDEILSRSLRASTPNLNPDVLLIVDMQNYVMGLGGIAREAANRTEKLVSVFRGRVPIIYTVMDSTYEPNWNFEDEILPQLAPRDGDIVVHKRSMSAFEGTTLDATLRRLKVKDIMLFGAYTDQCISATITDKDSSDYNIALVENCCITYGNRDTKYHDLNGDHAKVVSHLVRRDNVEITRLESILRSRSR